MHPYVSADIAAAHVADLRREAAIRCCSAAARRPVVDRIRVTVQRATAALHRTSVGTTPVCCPA